MNRRHLALDHRRKLANGAAITSVKAALSKIYFDVGRTKRQKRRQTEDGEDEKDTSLYEYLCRDLIAGPDMGVPEHYRRSQYGISERKPAVASRIQSKNCDYTETAAASQRAASRPSFYCWVRRKIVLRVSDCYDESDPGW
jgi:hypothetical protein